MTNQKHTVSTDALDTLGTCPIPEGSGRDAIHLAVEPVICGPENLQAGRLIRLVNGNVAISAKTEAATGIVDPFIAGTIKPGQRFWFVVLPRTITSLRHVWSHPSFPEAGPEAYHADDDDHYVTPRGNEMGANWTAADWNDRQSVPAPEPVESMAKAWMRDYCREIGERYEYIMAGAKKYLECGARTYGEKDSGNLDSTDIPPEFWVRYHEITKEDISEAEQNGGQFFSCSC